VVTSLSKNSHENDLWEISSTFTWSSQYCCNSPSISQPFSTSPTCPTYTSRESSAAVNVIYPLTTDCSRDGPIDLEAKFEPSLLNTAIYLLGLAQQVSTFAINFQGRPFREGITENSALYWGLVAAAGVAFSGATDLIPELNRPLQIVEMELPVCIISLRYRNLF
jgi:magnesium-transporting ATPase (P-type)